jgi:hypothetical protein
MHRYQRSANSNMPTTTASITVRQPNSAGHVVAQLKLLFQRISSESVLPAVRAF